MFDVYTTIRIRVDTPDINKAENVAMDLLDFYLADMSEWPHVVETDYTMSGKNPRSKRVKAIHAG